MSTSGSVIDQLWIALGIRADGEGLKDIKHQVNEVKESLLSAGTAVKAFLTAFAVHEVAKIGSTFEQNSIQIAGFLSALGQSSDFNQGLKDAADVIQQITKDAARLPGEADEYIEVFKAGFPFVKAAMPGGSLKDMTDFTNQLTAIGKTFGLDAGLIAREFDHMLSAGKGQASLRLPLFRQLMAFMRHVPGQAKLTAESFNEMTAPKRLQLLQSTFAQLQPMLDASATSFDAMWGAAVSAVKQMTRFATAPLFKAMKQGLDQFNSLFYDSNGKLTAFGQNFVDTIGRGVKYLTQFLAMGGHLLMWLVQSSGGVIALKTVLTLLGLALAGLALEKTVAGFTGLLRVVTNFKAILTGGLLAVLGLLIEDLYQFYTGGQSVTGLLVERWAPALTLIKGLIGALAFSFVYANPLGKALFDVLGVGIGKVFSLLGPLIGRVIGFGIAWAVANLPIVLTIAALAAVGFAIYELWKHWDQVVGWMKGVWDKFVGGLVAAKDAVKNALGFGSGPEGDPNANGGAPGDNGGGLNPPKYTGRGLLGFGDAPSPTWTPAAAPQAAGLPAAAGNVQQTTINHNTFNIKSSDPASAAKEVTREQARNAQSKVKM